MFDDILEFCDEDDEVPPIDDTAEEVAEEETGTAEIPIEELESEEEPPVNDEPEEEETVYDEEISAASNVLIQISEQLSKIMAKNEELENQVVQLTRKVDESNRAVKAHENIERRMNEELEKHRKNLYASIAEPFINQFIVIHNSFLCDLVECQRDLSKLSEDDKEEAAVLEELINTLDNYIRMVEGAFCNCGVEVFKPEVNIPMDEIRCCIVGTVASDDASLHGYIESVLSCGYAYNNKILRQAKVKVYKSK